MPNISSPCDKEDSLVKSDNTADTKTMHATVLGQTDYMSVQEKAALHIEEQNMDYAAKEFYGSHKYFNSVLVQVPEGGGTIRFGIEIGTLNDKEPVASEKEWTVFDDFRLLYTSRTIDTIVSVPNDYSFPSGHAGASFVVSTVIARHNLKYGLISLATSVLIAFSRLYFYVHYPTDVLTGAAIGVFSGIIMDKIVIAKLKQRDERKAAEKAKAAEADSNENEDEAVTVPPTQAE